jgi:hypothetical protein
MSLFEGVQLDNSAVQDEDRVGGSNFAKIEESGAYKGIIELAYLGESTSGAKNITIHFKTTEGATHRETIYYTSGKAKGCKTTYTDATGTVRNLPGFKILRELAAVAGEVDVTELDVEEKVVALYDFAEKKEVPTEVQVLTDLVGKPVILGIIKNIEDKQAKADDGSYQPTGETVVRYYIDTVFSALEDEPFTFNELVLRQEQPDTKAAFYDKWVKSWEGKERDRTAAKKGHTSAKADDKASGTTTKVGIPQTATTPKRPLFKRG